MIVFGSTFDQAKGGAKNEQNDASIYVLFSLQQSLQCPTIVYKAVVTCN